MTDNRNSPFYTRWRNKNGISLLVFSLYFIPLTLAFLIFSAFPENSKTLLALFTMILSVSAIFLIITLKSIIDAGKAPAYTPEAIPNQELAIQEAIEQNERAAAEFEEQITLQKEQIDRLQEENQHLTAQLKSHHQETETSQKHAIMQRQQLLDEVQSEHDKVATAFNESLQEKNRLLSEQEALVGKLKQELANTKFELETLLKLEVREETASKIAPSVSIAAPSFFAAPTSKKQIPLPPSLYTTTLTHPGTTHPSTLVNPAKKAPKAMVHLHDQKLVYLLDKTKDLSKTGHSVGEQLELPAFLDLSLDTLAIEKRRLIDVLKAEADLPSFIINCQDAKLIFVSPGVKAITGIAPDRFQKDFLTIVGNSKEHIKNALALLKPSEKTKIPIQLKTGPYEEQSVVLSIGVCPLPPFSRSAIGILETSES